MKNVTRNVLLAFAFLALTAGLACRQEPSRWDDAQKKSQEQIAEKKKEEKQNPASKPVEGGKLNKFFPKGGDGFDVVPSQEKEGFAEYKLKKDGKEMALLAISDTFGNPQAVEKFKTSPTKIGGYPATAVGNTRLTVLVGDRFQVSAIAKSPNFRKSDSEAWIQKFDLAGLAQLK